MLILTGPQGCGKTTLLQTLITAHRLTVQGFLSLKTPGMTGIELMLLPERRTVSMAVSTPGLTTVSTRHFSFDPGIFAVVEREFENLNPGLPFVFDECGPLEMKEQGHFRLLLRLLQQGPRLLIVVRPRLVEAFQARYRPERAAEVLDLEHDTRVEERILTYLRGRPDA